MSTTPGVPEEVEVDLSGLPEPALQEDLQMRENSSDRVAEFLRNVQGDVE